MQITQHVAARRERGVNFHVLPWKAPGEKENAGYSPALFVLGSSMAVHEHRHTTINTHVHEHSTDTHVHEHTHAPHIHMRKKSSGNGILDRVLASVKRQWQTKGLL